jgi:hypothetical protein
MTKSTKRRVGRPKSTGAGTPMVVRMHEPQIMAVDLWIGDSGISRPEAIRQLVKWALEHVRPVEDPGISIVKRVRNNELRRPT